MDEIIEFKSICRAISKETGDAKIIQATNEWFAGFLENFVAGVSDIIVMIHNNLDIEKNLIKLDEKIYGIHKKKKLIESVMQEFIRALPDTKENAQAIESIIIQ